MYLTFKRFLAWGLLACLPLVAAGCGGGGDGGGPVPMTTVSGMATIQGPITNALVEVFQLNPNGSPGALLGTGISGTDGRYAIPIPASAATAPLLIKVSGQAGATYTSPTAALPINFTAGEAFSAAVDLLSTGQVIAVSPLSDAGYNKLQQVLTADPLLVADAGTVNATNAYVASIFNVTDLLADPTVAANVSNLAALTVIDQMIADSNTGNTLAITSLIGNAVADVTAPPYQNFLILLNAAGNTVIAAEPPSSALVIPIQDLLANAANPPQEPDFSDAIAPTAPTGLTIKAATLTTTTASAELAWNASTDNIAVTGYEIYRDGSRIATVRTPGFTDSALIPGNTYSYFIISVDGAGNRSVASSSVSVTPNPVNLGVTVNGQLSSSILNLPEIFDLTAPTAPTNLSATTAAVSATTSSVTLTWSPATDNKGVTGYEVFRDGSKTATVTSTTYVDATVSSGVAHTYSITAVDAAGNKSPSSSTITVTPPAANLDITVNGQLSTSITGF